MFLFFSTIYVFRSDKLLNYVLGKQVTYDVAFKRKLSWTSTTSIVDLVPGARCFLQSVGNVTHSHAANRHTHRDMTWSLPSHTFPTY